MAETSRASFILGYYRRLLILRVIDNVIQRTKDAGAARNRFWIICRRQRSLVAGFHERGDRA